MGLWRSGKAINDPRRGTKIGATFPHKEGSGFSIELSAFFDDGRLVVLPPDPADDRNNK
jgi:hypothetical protein